MLGDLSCGQRRAVDGGLVDIGLDIGVGGLAVDPAEGVPADAPVAGVALSLGHGAVEGGEIAVHVEHGASGGAHGGHDVVPLPVVVALGSRDGRQLARVEHEAERAVITHVHHAVAAPRLVGRGGAVAHDLPARGRGRADPRLHGERGGSLGGDASRGMRLVRAVRGQAQRGSRAQDGLASALVGLAADRQITLGHEVLGLVAVGLVEGPVVGGTVGQDASTVLAQALALTGLDRHPVRDRGGPPLVSHLDPIAVGGSRVDDVGGAEIGALPEAGAHRLAGDRLAVHGVAVDVVGQGLVVPVPVGLEGQGDDPGAR